MNTFAERLLLLRGKIKQNEFAKLLEINPNTLRSYENGLALPNQKLLESICVKFSVFPEWLLLGTGPMYATKEAGSEEGISQASVAPLVPARDIPVIGLASCGLAGWYNPGPLAFRLPMPLGLPATGTTFAVIAVGKSMQPAGIFQGHLLFCDSAIPLDKGDTIYIEKKDGTASIKRYLCRDEKWLHLQGWLDPDDEGNQKPYNEELLLETVSKTACVTLIKLKA